jgi:hypothetical protein
MKKLISILSILIVTIGMAAAQSSSMGRQLENMVLAFKEISTLVYSSLFVVALILFITGIMRYMMPGSGPEDRKKGFAFMGFGIVALFVMVSVWGLVAFIGNTIGVQPGATIRVPTPPTPPAPPTMMNIPQ